MERLGRNSPRIAALRRAVRRRPEGRVVVDGRRLIEDLVRWGVPLEALYLSESAAAGAADWPPVAAAGRCWVVADTVMERTAPTRHPQGVLAVVLEPRPRPWSPGDGVTVLLEAVREPGNVGAVVRAAAGLGAEAVLLGPGCADPFHPAAVRGSAGAVFRIPVHREAGTGAAIRAVREAGGSAWAAAAGGEDARSWRPRPPVLLALGNEGRGLEPATLAAVDGTVGIALAREIESLNVAVAAALLLWRATGPA